MANDLPEGCPECQPYGGNFRIVNDAAARCKCPRGQALKLRSLHPVPPRRADPVLTAEEITMAVEGLSAIPFFPGGEVARTMIGDAVAQLCADAGTCFELVRRMISMYDRWPGVREMRILYCSMRPPLAGEDLRTAISEVYPEGFSSKRLESSARLALPPGQTLSAAPRLEAAIVEAAASMPAMPKARLIGRAEQEFSKFLEEAITSPSDRPELGEAPTNRNYKPIWSAAEFQQRLADERAKKQA